MRNVTCTDGVDNMRGGRRERGPLWAGLKAGGVRSEVECQRPRHWMKCTRGLGAVKVLASKGQLLATVGALV